MSSSPKNAKARKKDEVRFSLELLEKGKGQCDFATVIAETRDELSHRESEEKNRSTLYRTKERFNQKEFKQIMESGEVAYTKKCKELQVYPSVKIAKQLRTDTLNVEGYGIEDMHAVALAEAIKVNSNLTAIDLSDNQIGYKHHLYVSSISFRYCGDIYFMLFWWAFPVGREDVQSSLTRFVATISSQNLALSMSQGRSFIIVAVSATKFVFVLTTCHIILASKDMISVN